MDESYKCYIIIYLRWGHKLYARGRQIFKYGPAYNV
jgi:hypothetical protein